MGQPNGGIRLVDVLAAGALGAVGVHADLVPVQLDRDVLVRLGHHLDEAEGGLAPVLGIERADPDQAVDAPLRAEPAVRAPSVDGDGHALEAGLLALLLVDDLRLPAVPLRPPEVHPQEHCRPVGGLGAAGAGADRQDRGPAVVLAGEEQLRAFAGEVRVEVVDGAVDLGLELGVAGFLG